MAAATSPATNRRYGVARVCRVWDAPRSSFYAARQQKPDIAAPPTPARRRGPKPVVADEALLAAIRADLARSPWIGEGHRKVWARLRVIDAMRVARKRVLRLMREHSLLSPHRARTHANTPHDRQIITSAPNLMWATDATQIATVRDGKVWLFGVIEHWNAELLGWNVAKRGTRFEAAQAVGMAVRQQFGHLSAGAARPGLAPRPWQQLHGRALPQADQVLGHLSELRLRPRTRDEWRDRALLPHIQGTGRARPHLPDHRRRQGRRPLLRRTLQCPVADREERLQKPERRQKLLEQRNSQPSRLTQTLCPEIRVRYRPFWRPSLICDRS